MLGRQLMIALTTAIGISMVALPVIAKPGQPNTGSAKKVLAHLDTDGDGVVSLTEFIDANLARVETKFLRRDQNGDGVISEDEVGHDRPEPPDGFDAEAFRACVEELLGGDLPERPEPGARFAEADLNGDGVIDLDEAISNATDRATDRFFELDQNGDNVLDVGELAVAKARHRKAREAKRACREQAADVVGVLGS